MAWTVGYAGGGAPVVLVIDLPEVPEPDTLAPAPPTDTDLRPWVAALRAGRVALQRDAGWSGLHTAVGAFAESIGAGDAFLVLRHAEQMRVGKSVRGVVLRSLIDRTDLSWGQALGQEAGLWLGREACDELGVGPSAELLAVPLTAEQTNLGFAVFMFASRPDIDEQAQELLAEFAALLAASLRRDRAVAARQKLRGAGRDGQPT